MRHVLVPTICVGGRHRPRRVSYVMPAHRWQCSHVADFHHWLTYLYTRWSVDLKLWLVLLAEMLGGIDRILKLLLYPVTQPTLKLVTSLIQSTAPPVPYSPHCAAAPSVSRPPHLGFAITLKTRHAREDSSGRVISQTQRLLTRNHTTDRHPRNRRYSNPQSQQASERKPTPSTTRPSRSATVHFYLL
jgi:hypothetical protein